MDIRAALIRESAFTQLRGIDFDGRLRKCVAEVLNGELSTGGGGPVVRGQVMTLDEASCNPTGSRRRLRTMDVRPKVTGRRRRYWSLGVVTSVLVGLSAVASPAAQAYNLLGCKWNGSSISYNTAAAVGYASNVTSAAVNWNAVTTHDFISTSSTTGAYVRAAAANYGNTGWSGYSSPWGSPGTNLSCSGGTYSGQKGLYLNGTYLSAYTSAKRTAVAAHEFGHLAGLAHNNAVATCSGGQQGARWLMFSTDGRFNNNPCGAVLGPESDDINGFNAIY